MSYGSKTCPHCQGEVKVSIHDNGTASGWCPHCRKTWTFGRRVHQPRIPDEGAFYEVIVDEWTDEYQGIKFGMHSWKEVSRNFGQSLAIYTDLEQARKRCEEVRTDADAKCTDTVRVRAVASIKRWNHDRTEWEWWRPEWAEVEA